MKPCTVCGTDVTGTCHFEVRSAHYLWARGTLPKTTYYCAACHAARFSGEAHDLPAKANAPVDANA